MEEQIFWNFKFCSVCLKVLRNAVLLSYHAPESVHGAPRTKQNKISNFEMVRFLVFFFGKRNISHVEVWNLVLFRSRSSVNRFWSMVAQKNSVAEYFQTNSTKFENSKFLILHFQIFDFLLCKLLKFWTKNFHKMNSNMRNNARISIRHTDILNTIGKVTLTNYELIRSIFRDGNSIQPPNLETNLLTNTNTIGVKKRRFHEKSKKNPRSGMIAYSLGGWGVGVWIF